MTDDASGSVHVLGSLGSADGAGVIRIEEHFETGIDELWSALTDRERLARWYGEIEGELRAGGEFHARVCASGWEGIGRIEECDPPRRFRVVSKDPDEPNEETVEVVLSGDSAQTTLVVVQGSLPLNLLWAYGAGPDPRRRPRRIRRRPQGQRHQDAVRRAQTRLPGVGRRHQLAT